MYSHRFKTKTADTTYHCVSRTVNGEILFDDTAKEVMRRQLHAAADFSGVEIITYALMGNHFHVLVRVPEQAPAAPSDAELLRRYKVLYPKPTKFAPAEASVLEAMLKANGADATKWRTQMLTRMGDVSEFMKTFKQRFSVWFNRTHKRFGPLWAERFSSTIVQGNRHFALESVAAYVDLNPVRAKLAADPKDYRFCGYAEAVATGGPILKGLRRAVRSENCTDSEMLEAYRMVLFGKGAAPKHHDRDAARIPDEARRKVESEGGKLSPQERLRLRMSWFVRGGVIGSRAFVKTHLEEYRRKTHRRLHTPPIPFGADTVGTEWPEDLYAMRRRR